MTMTYSEQLRDVRWQKLRLEAMSAAGWKCQDCGGADFLNVHHKKYISGRKPWEYGIGELKVLCEGCHQKIHGLVFVPDHLDEGQHMCGDWHGDNWRRDGSTFFVNGIPLHLAKWDFCEDGMYGAVYFAVSDLIFEPGSKNGASFSPFPSAPSDLDRDAPSEYPERDAFNIPIRGLVRCATPLAQETIKYCGINIPIRGLVRCATPCMQDGENFMPFPMEWFIFQAAQFAFDNLTRKS
jgi:hypothetical protein